MKLNFKNFKKSILNVGLTAILASSALGVNEADGATSSYKDADRIEYNIKDIEARWAKQEKQLTPEQKALWKEMTSDKRFKNILPRILNQLNITKIKRVGSRDIVIEIAQHVGLIHDKGMGDFYLLNTGKSMANNVIPAHDMSNFMVDKLDCFFVPQTEDKNLTSDEKEIVQTLDKCLNEVYTFVYARGMSNINKEALMNGDYAGMVWDTHIPVAPSRPDKRLTPTEKKESDKLWDKNIFKAFCYKNVEELKTDYPSYTQKYSNLENEFFMSLGYPYSIKDLAEIGARFYLTGGCDGEMGYEIMPSGGAHGVSWVYKPTTKMAEQTLHQYIGRKLQGLEVFCDRTKKAFEEEIFPKYRIDLKGRNKLTTLQKALIKRSEIARTYNRKIRQFINHAKRAEEIPESLAHKVFLNSYLTENFKKQHAAQKVGLHAAGKMTNAQKKNQSFAWERGN